MSTNKPGKKKSVVVPATRPAAQPTKRSASEALEPAAFTFNASNYLWMGIGFALVLIGLALMMGGEMPDSDTWDESIIYSTRRTLISPLVILAGLVVEVYAIFKK